MVLSQGHNTLEVSQQITQLEDITHTVERRLLHLIGEGAAKAVSPEDLVGELSFLAKEIKRCYRRIVEMKDRRDLGFKVTAGLQEIDQHCIWLYRRIHMEGFFFRKWQLETKLRALISPEAFGVYQEILDTEGREREFLTRADAEIRRLLLEESGGGG